MTKPTKQRGRKALLRIRRQPPVVIDLNSATSKYPPPILCGHCGVLREACTCAHPDRYI